MTDNAEKIIKNIENSMKMENIPLSEEDIARIRLCISEKRDFYEVLQEIIINHTYNTEYVTVRS